MANEGRKDEARALLFGETKKYFENLRESIEKNIASVQAVSHDLADEADALFIFSRLSGMILILVALLASAGLTFLIVRHVGNLLGKNPSELQKIAQRVVNGDYAIDDGKAKAGVYGSIVSMVDALKSNIDAARRESENARQQTAKAEEAVARAEEAQKQAQSKSAAMISIADRLASMSEVMASASSQLAERISQADQASQESSARLSDAAAIGQMNASVSEVASNASSAAQASTSTKEKAEAGAHIVEKVVHSIEEIYQVSTALKQDMEQLNAHAQAINDIMVVISDIADQTNLLALNAAIEAARAGEAGRGFAVVADEVRKLAEKTMSSTQDVAAAIRAIQGSTEQSVRAMEAVAQKVGEANQYAGDSGKALQAIVATVENAAMQVHAIATASEEQSAASEEINSGIMQVDSMAKQNLDAMNQAAQAVQQLVSQAGTLNTLVHELREA
ncbi:methyl-accepting chemotaxis protein [uncultured Desulfovibrio sp.]|uniref:methyl-accepting chemotaxis protein n=1 Tax=uncultured Desulfovibrio sp. TaxID=167968 RepID=UPI00261BA896|nr:methyl-accepting chemotaxis protein [uncultured Desulfovibrio sp.]